jgi:hypothetical protein
VKTVEKIGKHLPGLGSLFTSRLGIYFFRNSFLSVSQITRFDCGLEYREPSLITAQPTEIEMSSLFKPLAATVGLGALVVASFASDAHAFQIHSRSPLTRSWGSLGSYSTQSRPAQSRPGVVIGHLPQYASRVYAPQLPYRAPSPHFFRYDPARIQANQQIFRQRQAQQYNNARAQWVDDRARQAKQQDDKRFRDQSVIAGWYSQGLCPTIPGRIDGGYYPC